MDDLSISIAFISAVHGKTNLAFQRPTFQSSGRDSNKAVDGNKDPNIYGNGCTHTYNDEMGTWWLVDLQKVYRISTIEVTNRGDCCGEWDFQCNMPNADFQISLTIGMHNRLLNILDRLILLPICS